MSQWTCDAKGGKIGQGKKHNPYVNGEAGDTHSSFAGSSGEDGPAAARAAERGPGTLANGNGNGNGNRNGASSKPMQPITYLEVRAEVITFAEEELADTFQGGSGETGTNNAPPQERRAQDLSMCFYHRCLRYTYNDKTGRYLMQKTGLGKVTAENLRNRFFRVTSLQQLQRDLDARTPQEQAMNIGLGGAPYNEMRLLRAQYGVNRVKPDEKKTYGSSLVKEATSSYFYAFQIFSQLLWIFLDSYLMTAIYLTIFAVALFVKAWYSYKAWARLVEMSRNYSRVRAWRRGMDPHGNASFCEVTSEELLPGDVMEITDGMVMPVEV